MSKPIVQLPGATADLVEIAAWLELENEPLSERFIKAVEGTFERLSEHSGIGHPCHFASESLRGLRSWPVRGFGNHLIFYIERGGELHILRVLHGARDMEGLLGEP